MVPNAISYDIFFENVNVLYERILKYKILYFSVPGLTIL